MKTHLPPLAPTILLSVALLMSQSAGNAAVLTPAVTFASATTTGNARGITFDGTYYWSASTNTVGGQFNLAQYDASGTLVDRWLVPFPFRGITSNLLGEVYGFNNASQIMKMTSPGVFSVVGTLSGGDLANSLRAKVLNGDGTEFVALEPGTDHVNRWSLTGTFLGFVTLQGFGTEPNEELTPANLTMAAGPNAYYTYSGSGVVSTWDLAGNRVRQDTLSPAFTVFEGNHSFSFTNGMFFTLSGGGGNFNGFGAPTPEPGTLGLLGAALGVVFLRRRTVSRR